MILDPSKSTMDKKHPNMRSMSPSKQNIMFEEFETDNLKSQAFMSYQTNRTFYYPKGLPEGSLTDFETQDLSQQITMLLFDGMYADSLMIIEFKENIELSVNYTKDKSDKFDRFKGNIKGVEAFATQIHRF